MESPVSVSPQHSLYSSLNPTQWQIQLSMHSAAVRFNRILARDSIANKHDAVIFLIRVYAIWSNRNTILAILLAAYIVS